VRGFAAAAVVLGLALAHAALDPESGVAAWRHLRGELADARARIVGARGEVAGLRAEVARAQDGGFALEAAIREDLQLARPGQTVVRLRGDGASSARIP
jgi:cell division protein FtsB